MRRATLSVLIGVLLLGAAPEEANPFADVHLSLADLDALGGLAIGEPYRDRAERWVLRVDCNVAGARHVTAKPTRTEPSQGVRRVSSAIDGDTITIWVLAALPRDESPVDPECRGAFLGYPKSGQYQVVYREPAGETRALGTAVVPDYTLTIPGLPR